MIIIKKSGTIVIGDKVYAIIRFDGRCAKQPYTRIDLFDSEDMVLYNEHMPTVVIASYIEHQGKHFRFGDFELLDIVERLFSEFAMLSKPPKSSFEGTKFKQVTQEGEYVKEISFVGPLRSSEIYVKGSLRIEFFSFDNVEVFALPNNFSEYKTMGADLQDKLILKIKQGKSIGPGEIQQVVPGLRSIEFLKANYKIDHLFDSTYDFRIIKSEEEADEWIRALKTHPGKIRSIDVETTGDDVWVAGDDRITLVSLGYDERTSIQFPFRQKNFGYNLPIEYLGKIYNAVNKLPKSIVMTAHGAIMEINAFRLEGYPKLRIDLDTLILGRLSDPSRARGYHTLKSWASRLLKKEFLPIKAIFTGKIDFSIVTEELSLAYAGPDGPNPIVIYNRLIRKMTSAPGILALEMKLLYVKAENSYFGLPLNIEQTITIREACDKNFKILEDLTRNTYQCTGNLNSSEVKKDLIYNKMGAPVTVLTKKGKPATNKDAIKLMAKSYVYSEEELPKDVNVSPVIGYNLLTGEFGEELIKESELKYSKQPGLLFLEKMSAFSKERSNMDRFIKTYKRGRIPLYVDSTGTVSGRQTSNAQQNSEMMKVCISTEKTKYVLMPSDYSQIELRIMAFLAKCQKLIDKCSEEDIDIHRVIASLAMQCEIYEIIDEIRKIFKMVNFGIVYLISDYGLARRIHDGDPTPEQVKEAGDWICRVFGALPEIKRLIESIKSQILTLHKVETAFGRVRIIKELEQAMLSMSEISAIVRSANNTPTQGSAADLMKIAEVNLYEYRNKMGWDKETLQEETGLMLPQLILNVSVHDEVCLEVNPDNVILEEVIKMVKEGMEIEIEGAPPFFTSMSCVKRWADVDLLKSELPTSIRNDILRDYETKEDYQRLTIDTWLANVNKRREDKFKSYLNAIIAKHGREAYKYVNHDIYTFMLLDSYIRKDDMKKLPTQLERIKLAVSRYMQDEIKQIVVDKDTSAYSDEAIISMIASEASDYIGLDEDYQEVKELQEHKDDEEEEELNIIEDYDYGETEIDLREDVITQFLDTILVNLTGLSREDSVSIIKTINKFVDESRYSQYTITLMKDNEFKELKKGIEATLVPDLKKEVSKIIPWIREQQLS